MLFSAPGAGKNTQCDLLVEKFKFVHFGAGDLLREEVIKNNFLLILFGIFMLLIINKNTLVKKRL